MSWQVEFKPTLRHRIRRLLRRRPAVTYTPTDAKPTGPKYQGGYCLTHGWWFGEPTCPKKHAPR